MIRIYFENSIIPRQIIILAKEVTHYLINVMRQKIDDNIALFNKRDGEWIASIIQIERNECRVIVIDCIRKAIADSHDTKPQLVLACALIKNATPSFIVQKATELGIDVIQPVIFERSVVNKLNINKLHQTAIDATEQCGRLSVPEINEIIFFKSFIQNCQESNQSGSKICLIIGVIEDNIESLCTIQIMNRLVVSKDYLPIVFESYAKIITIIGPEGGFGDNELINFYKLHRFCDIVYIQMGDLTLRSETSIISLLTIQNVFLNKVNFYH